MKIFYNPDSNYLEFFREHGVENYGDVDENDVMIFKAEEDDRIIGFGLEDATKNIKVLLSNLFEHERLPLLLKITRKIEHLTQEQLAEKTWSNSTSDSEDRKWREYKVRISNKGKESISQYSF